MIEMHEQANHDITPADLKPEQDLLNLAGSKVSFKDIYAREIDLPVIRNKYYSMDDVDDLFILINGMFTSISEQAYRNNQTVINMRKENDQLNANIRKLTAEKEQIDADNKSLIAENADLQTKAKNNNTVNPQMQQALKTAAEKLLKQNKIIQQQNEIIASMNNNNTVLKNK